MTDQLPLYQLFATTLLLSTPSELHHLWIEQKRDFPLIAIALADLGFSITAIAAIEKEYFEPLKAKEALRQSFQDIGDSLKAGLPFYDPTGGVHPMTGQAKAIVAALRAADETSSAARFVKG